MKPTITVCMATYNGSKFLKSQLDSILCQLHESDDLIVCDDGSDDGTMELLLSYGHRIFVRDNNQVGGVVKNFERVLFQAQGDIIILADQDDVWLPGRLDRVRAEISQADVVLVNAKIVDENLKDSGTTLFDVIGVRQGLSGNFVKNGFVGCCMAFRREVLEIALPFPHNLPWHDWYIGLIGELLFRVKRVDDPYILYRRHGSNFSETGSKSNYNLLKKCSIRFWILYALMIAMFRKMARGFR